MKPAFTCFTPWIDGAGDQIPAVAPESSLKESV